MGAGAGGLDFAIADERARRATPPVGGRLAHEKSA
jgi:hypothetical protein